MAKRAQRAPRKPGGGAARIDWAVAEAWYFGDPTRSFGDVAREFGVSDTAVRKHATPGRWKDRRDESSARIARRLLDRGVRSREERALVIQRIADEVADQLQEKLVGKSLELKLSDYPALEKLVALVTGEPTDRVTFEEQMAGLRTVTGIAAKYVPKARRAAFLAEVNEALGAGE